MPLFPSQQALALVATTGVAGYTLVNGTPTILTWTAPNDGQLHRVQLFGSLWVASTETGGNIALNLMLPNGNSGSVTVDTGNHGVNFHPLSVATNDLIIGAGTTVTLTQSAALTVGAATLWAELWAA